MYNQEKYVLLGESSHPAYKDHSTVLLFPIHTSCLHSKRGLTVRYFIKMGTVTTFCTQKIIAALTLMSMLPQMAKVLKHSINNIIIT